jgi:hypothetical protein
MTAVRRRELRSSAAPRARRRLSVYDGRAFLGRIDVGPDGEARAFDAAGKVLGKFPTLKVAFATFNPLVEPRAGRRA